MRGSGESGHVGAYHGEDRLCRVLPDAGNLRQELHKLLHVSGEVVIYDGIYLIDPLVEKPESLMIRELPGATDKDVTILIVAEDDDCARLIGKKGSVANALRAIVAIAGKADDTDQRIHLKFESFEDEKESEDDGK